MFDHEKSSFWNGSPQTMFFMGLFLGLAVSAIAALLIIFNLFWSGKSLTIGTGNNNVVAAAPSPTPSLPDPTQPSQPANPVQPVAKTDHVLGAANAKVTLIEYSDFQCPFCKQHEPSIEQALKDFPKDVRVVYRHFPLSSIHPYAEKAAEASECAAKMGGNDAFWKMHDKMFEKSPDLGSDVLVSLAKEIGLNETSFKSCLDSGEMQGRVQADFTSGNDAGVQGTPATFVNGKLISGAVPYTTLKAEITSAGAKG
jgi:protein-disulfide isomerase